MPSAPGGPRSVVLLALVLAAAPAIARSPSNQCLIKGSISSKGERIHHPPGCRYCNVTMIDPNRGERWFCSEADGVAAGWRRTKVC